METQYNATVVDDQHHPITIFATYLHGRRMNRRLFLRIHSHDGLRLSSHLSVVWHVQVHVRVHVHDGE